MNSDERMPEKSHSQKGNRRKRGRSWKGNNDEDKADLKTIGIRDKHAVARDQKERTRIVMEAKVHTEQ
jgi:hypothetical protein